MKIHRIVMYVIDSDGLGAQGVKDELENTRYANDCIVPEVGEVQTRDIGEWSDSHPLNQRGSEALREEIFTKPATEKDKS